MGFYLMKPRFPLGRVIATPGVLVLGVDLGSYLRRHQCGDWDDEDKHANEDALEKGLRLLSRFSTPEGLICIITVHDRSVTTILLPSEY